MGGKAFRTIKPPLDVVRLPGEQWITLSEAYQQRLLQYFEQAKLPPEALKKEDHGDIDIIAAGQLQPQMKREDLAAALGAMAHTQVGSIRTFAIGLPNERCRCLLGLAFNDSGLHLHIAEIEQTKTGNSLLFLTICTNEIFTFLGLYIKRFDCGFKTLDELFLWATQSRHFRCRSFVKHVLSDTERRARETRLMYGAFTDEWLPQHTECGQSPAFERIDILDEALQSFNKRPEYEIMLQTHHRRLLKDNMWRKIAKASPLEDKELGETIVALKALLWWNDGKPEILEEAERGFEKIPTLATAVINEALLPWAREHWKDALTVKRAQDERHAS